MKKATLDAIQALMSRASQLRDLGEFLEDDARRAAIAAGEERLATAIEHWTLSRTALRWSRVLDAMARARARS